mmetsp:Transcript_18693/g.46426  ORF Transcript_18693/g.46426 Transcript_18693/m.46426 type:complete len:221 (-) Transcript_18693:99-761(-)
MPTTTSPLNSTEAISSIESFVSKLRASTNKASSSSSLILPFDSSWSSTIASLLFSFVSDAAAPSSASRGSETKGTCSFVESPVASSTLGISRISRPTQSSSSSGNSTFLLVGNSVSEVSAGLSSSVSNSTTTSVSTFSPCSDAASSTEFPGTISFDPLVSSSLTVFEGGAPVSTSTMSVVEAIGSLVVLFVLVLVTFLDFEEDFFLFFFFPMAIVECEIL